VYLYTSINCGILVIVLIIPGHTNFTVEELLSVVFELAGNTQFTKENTAAGRYLITKAINEKKNIISKNMF
jgi:hypothetical protein